jgi:hypothetical protein
MEERPGWYDDVAVRVLGLVLARSRFARLASFYGFAANRSTGAATMRGACAGIFATVNWLELTWRAGGRFGRAGGLVGRLPVPRD